VRRETEKEERRQKRRTFKMEHILCSISNHNRNKREGKEVQIRSLCVNDVPVD
jgi:hypothetical protein